MPAPSTGSPAADFPYDICTVGGLGHIGLPLSLLFAEAGKKVVCYDLNSAAADTVRAGRMPFYEEGAQDILDRVLDTSLFVSLDASCVSESRFLIVVIGTPVDEHLNPQFTGFRRFLEDLLPHLRDGQHLILCSTVFPGTTQRVRDLLASHGKRVRVSFCPERVAQGKSIVEHKAFPQIISSFDRASLDEAHCFWSAIAHEIIEVEPLEAELAKLFTNSWRYIQFAIANQFYRIATEHDVDYYRVLDAIRHHYPRADGLPRAGFTAGPCLFKDTMQIAAFSNDGFFLGHAAMLINEGLPTFIVQRLKEKMHLRSLTVAILGMAFKADIDDKRESLAYKLRKILEIEAKGVLCTDPYIHEPGWLGAQDAIEQADVVIVAAPHSQYAALAIPASKTLVDPWNFFRRSGLPLVA